MIKLVSLARRVVEEFLNAFDLVEVLTEYAQNCTFLLLVE